jgi:tRNA (guanine37-N1)-methyltransferase
MIRFDILTIFPEMFVSPCGCSLLKKAADRGLIAIHLHDIRSHAEDKHHMTDDAPYGHPAPTPPRTPPPPEAGGGGWS